MIRDIWKGLHIFCGAHETPIEMPLVQHKGIFAYECPEKACRNAISSIDAEKFIDQLSEKMESGYALRNIRGFSSKIRGYQYFVTDHDGESINVSITSR